MTEASKGDGSNLTQEDKDRFYYTMGKNIGDNLLSIVTNNPEVIKDRSAFFKGFITGIKGESAKYDVEKVIEDFQKEMMEKDKKKADEAAVKTKEFMEKNKKQSGITETASGLQYEVLTKKDSGDMPTVSDMVTVHYKGTLVDGTEFDSSYKRNEPATFPLNGVILGWQEGIPLMKVGEKFRFFIPPNLGYGQGGTGNIPPNSVLIFEVELLSVKKGTN